MKLHKTRPEWCNQWQIPINDKTAKYIEFIGWSNLANVDLGVEKLFVSDCEDIRTEIPLFADLYVGQDIDYNFYNASGVDLNFKPDKPFIFVLQFNISGTVIEMYSDYFRYYSCNTYINVIRPCIDLGASFYRSNDDMVGTIPAQTILINRNTSGNLLAYVPQIYLRGKGVIEVGMEVDILRKANKNLKKTLRMTSQLDNEDFGKNYLSEVANLLGFSKYRVDLEGYNSDFWYITPSEESINIVEGIQKHSNFYRLSIKSYEEVKKYATCSDDCYFDTY
jgi:hypothetical protein